jgi:hypothetical protein
MTGTTTIPRAAPYMARPGGYTFQARFHDKKQGQANARLQ